MLPLRRDRVHRRTRVLGGLLGAALVATTLRFAYLAVFPSDLRARLLSQDSRQHLSTTVISTPRAPITDRRGRPLALTVMKPSVFIVPARLPLAETREGAAILNSLTRLSGIPRTRLAAWHEQGRQFVWLKRQTTNEAASSFASLPGWEDFGGVLNEPARYYPFGSLAAQLLGYTGIDNQGLAGLEAVYEDKIKGERQTVQVTRDARRRLAITWPNEASRPDVEPQPLVISIDAEVQRIMETELGEAVRHSGAQGGSGVVIDVTNGEVFALASLPLHDANRPETRTPESLRLRPVQDALELGSVMKPFVVAGALNSGAVRPGDRFNCENGELKLPGATIHDVKRKGVLDVPDILKFSSNVCMYKIARTLGRERLHSYLKSFGIVEPAGSGLPGEYAGDEQDPNSWREIRFANVSFGQGIAITPLQMARAAATLVSGGTRVPVRILRTDPSATGDEAGPALHSMTNLELPPAKVVHPDVSVQVRRMLARVVEDEDATAPAARLDEFSAGGKTGTAQKFSTVTRSYSERIPSFLGFFPAEHPRFVVYIVLDAVTVRPAFGGKLAAPVFAAVSNALGRYLKATGTLSLYDSRSSAGESR